MSKSAALLVEDDARLAALVREYLEKNDLEVVHAPDGERGLAILDERHVDVVLLDIMLPGIDGLEVCRRIREQHGLIPVIMLTARGDEVDRVVGLELGADDYLPKPFSPRELLARIRALLRRAAAGPAPGAERFKSGTLEIHFPSREVTVSGKRQVLTHFEFELLATLARAAGRVLSREHLMDTLRGEAFESFDRSIDVHISKLRAKIEVDPKSPRYIKTVRGVGYVLAKDA
jgi:DNA-binding response OmpR family regulator